MLDGSVGVGKDDVNDCNCNEDDKEAAGNTEGAAWREATKEVDEGKPVIQVRRPYTPTQH